MMTAVLKNRCLMMVVFVLFCFAIPTVSPAEDIQCAGQYGGHLQGIATDGKTAIFWPFTVDLVKTDMNGKVLTSITVPSHHGDLVYHAGRVYVAVNLGQFNQEPGKADSWVYVYDADDLTLLSKHEVQEVVHGAGGMTYRNGHFFVVGGLPDSYDENYVYEYDGDLSFVRRHVIASGHTRLGIQTVCYAGGYFWYGCYGYPENNALLRTDASFGDVQYFDTHTSVGIDVLADGTYIQGFTGKDEETGKWWGKVRRIRFDETKRGRFVPMK